MLSTMNLLIFIIRRNWTENCGSAAASLTGGTCFRRSMKTIWAIPAQWASSAWPSMASEKSSQISACSTSKNQAILKPVTSPEWSILKGYLPSMYFVWNLEWRMPFVEHAAPGAPTSQISCSDWAVKARLAFSCCESCSPKSGTRRGSLPQRSSLHPYWSACRAASSASFWVLQRDLGTGFGLQVARCLHRLASWPPLHPQLILPTDHATNNLSTRRQFKSIDCPVDPCDLHGVRDNVAQCQWTRLSIPVSFLRFFSRRLYSYENFILLLDKLLISLR